MITTETTPLTPAPDDNHVSAVRKMMVDQMRALRQAKTMDELDIETKRTRAISQIGSAIISMVRVEADYAHRSGTAGAVGFLEQPHTLTAVSSPLPGITVHRIR